LRRGSLSTKGAAITNGETSLTADVETVSLMEEARQGEVETVSPMGGARQTDVDGVASACGDTWRRKKILSVLGGHFRFNF